MTVNWVREKGFHLGPQDFGDSITGDHIADAARSLLDDNTYQLYNYNDGVPSGQAKDHQFVKTVDGPPQAGDILATPKPIQTDWYYGGGQQMGIATGKDTSIGITNNMRIGESDFGLKDGHEPTIWRADAVANMGSSVSNAGQNSQDQIEEPQLAMNGLERSIIRSMYPQAIDSAKSTINNITGGSLSGNDVDNITNQILRNADESELRSLQGARPDALTQSQFDTINQHVGKLTGPEGQRAQQAWQNAQDQGKVRVQKNP
jgi:hypothetical protein